MPKKNKSLAKEITESLGFLWGNEVPIIETGDNNVEIFSNSFTFTELKFISVACRNHKKLFAIKSHSLVSVRLHTFNDHL